MNSLLGPHYIDSDVSVRKLFKTFREENLELRFEFFNIFNHPNLANPVTSYSSSGFGQVQAQQGNPRQMQLGGQVHFLDVEVATTNVGHVSFKRKPRARYLSLPFSVEPHWREFPMKLELSGGDLFSC
jgi:hypothetical protein